MIGVASTCWWCVQDCSACRARSRISRRYLSGLWWWHDLRIGVDRNLWYSSIPSTLCSLGPRLCARVRPGSALRIHFKYPERVGSGLRRCCLSFPLDGDRLGGKRRASERGMRTARLLGTDLAWMALFGRGVAATGERFR